MNAEQKYRQYRLIRDRANASEKRRMQFIQKEFQTLVSTLNITKIRPTKAEILHFANTEIEKLKTENSQLKELKISLPVETPKTVTVDSVISKLDIANTEIEKLKTENSQLKELKIVSLPVETPKTVSVDSVISKLHIANTEIEKLKTENSQLKLPVETPKTVSGDSVISKLHIANPEIEMLMPAKNEKLKELKKKPSKKDTKDSLIRKLHLANSEIEKLMGENAQLKKGKKRPVEIYSVIPKKIAKKEVAHLQAIKSEEPLLQQDSENNNLLHPQYLFCAEAESDPHPNTVDQSSSCYPVHIIKPIANHPVTKPFQRNGQISMDTTQQIKNLCENKTNAFFKNKKNGLVGSNFNGLAYINDMQMQQREILQLRKEVMRLKVAVEYEQSIRSNLEDRISKLDQISNIKTEKVETGVVNQEGITTTSKSYNSQIIYQTPNCYTARNNLDTVVAAIHQIEVDQLFFDWNDNSIQ